MKELSIEEKAKRYDEALEKARQLCDYPTSKPFISDLQDLFPELAELEDEKIRKTLINGFNKFNESGVWYNGITNGQILAWLEKQGEQIDIVNKECWRGYREGKQEVLDKYTELEKQNKQKLTNQEDFSPKTALEAAKEEKVDNQNCVKPNDKVEPKFKVGDWVVRGDTIAQILDIQEQYYIGLDINGNDFTSSRFLSDDKIHLWTILDAKVGDVLYLQKDGKEHIIIYKGVIKERFRTFVSAYCAYNGIVDAFCFADVSRYVDIAYRGIMPATKEQRDLLFQKMKEEGYEWDAEKKELKKIEQKPQRMISAEAKEAMYDRPAWSEEDLQKEIKLQWKNCNPTDEGMGCEFANISVEQFDEIARYFFKLKYKIHNPTEWSEEDETKLTAAQTFIRNTSLVGNDGIREATIDWLNGLKNRVQQQPKKEWSVEDERKLNIICSLVYSSPAQDPFYAKISLEKWLRSLRPQNRWKPSNEQMEALKRCCDGWSDNGDGILDSLYEQLKKL